MAKCHIRDPARKCPRADSDDTKIYRAIENIDDFNTLQHDIDALLEWSSIWQLPFNTSKCKVMHFGKENPNHRYTAGEAELPKDNSEKDLGVTFDTQLILSYT